MGSFEVTGFQAGCGVPITWGQPRVNKNQTRSQA